MSAIKFLVVESGACDIYTSSTFKGILRMPRAANVSSSLARFAPVTRTKPSRAMASLEICFSPKI